MELEKVLLSKYIMKKPKNEVLTMHYTYVWYKNDGEIVGLII